MKSTFRFLRFHQRGFEGDKLGVPLVEGTNRLLATSEKVLFIGIEAIRAGELVRGRHGAGRGGMGRWVLISGRARRQKPQKLR